jgi:hypothetical protein
MRGASSLVPAAATEGGGLPLPPGALMTHHGKGTDMASVEKEGMTMKNRIRKIRRLTRSHNF